MRHAPETARQRAIGASQRTTRVSRFTDRSWKLLTRNFRFDRKRVVENIFRSTNQSPLATGWNYWTDVRDFFCPHICVDESTVHRFFVFAISPERFTMERSKLLVAKQRYKNIS